MLDERAHVTGSGRGDLALAERRQLDLVRRDKNSETTAMRPGEGLAYRTVDLADGRAGLPFD